VSKSLDGMFSFPLMKIFDSLLVFFCRNFVSKRKSIIDKRTRRNSNHMKLPFRKKEVLGIIATALLVLATAAVSLNGNHMLFHIAESSVSLIMELQLSQRELMTRTLHSTVVHTICEQRSSM